MIEDEYGVDTDMNKFDIIKEIKKFKEELEEEINDDHNCKDLDVSYYTGQIDAKNNIIEWLDGLLSSI